MLIATSIISSATDCETFSIPVSEVNRRFEWQDAGESGVDIGGTFTDVVLAEDETGRVALLKYRRIRRTGSSRPRCVEAVLARTGVAPTDVTAFIHGTTMALNTVIERSGARVGFIVTRGYRDILELGRLRLKDPQNFYASAPRRSCRGASWREIDERMLADGTVYRRSTRRRWHSRARTECGRMLGNRDQLSPRVRERRPRAHRAPGGRGAAPARTSRHPTKSAAEA